MSNTTQKPITLEDIAGKIDSLDTKVSSIDIKVSLLDTKIGSLDARVGSLETKMVSLDTKVTSLDTKIEDLALATMKGFREVDQQFVVVNKKLDKVESGLVDLNENVEKNREMTKAILVSHNRRILRVESKLGIA